MKKDVIRLATIAAVLITAVAVGTAFYSRADKEKKAAEAARQPPPQVSTLVRPHSHGQGPADAKVSVVEFLDPECESCRAMYPLVKHLVAQYPGKVRLVIRYMPFHTNSMYAISALEAAADQKKYWEMLEVLFENQPQWGSHHAPKPELIPGFAQQIGLEMTAFERTLNSAAHRTIIETDKADGQSLGVSGTPTFFVNGRRLERLGYETLKALVDEELARP
jgi:protein-disulfide isomerase